MKPIKNSVTYAFLIGFYERARYCDGYGRTHETNQSWNEAYDAGANWADKFFNKC